MSPLHINAHTHVICTPAHNVGSGGIHTRQIRRWSSRNIRSRRCPRRLAGNQSYCGKEPLRGACQVFWLRIRKRGRRTRRRRRRRRITWKMKNEVQRERGFAQEMCAHARCCASACDSARARDGDKVVCDTCPPGCETRLFDICNMTHRYARLISFTCGLCPFTCVSWLSYDWRLLRSMTHTSSIDTLEGRRGRWQIWTKQYSPSFVLINKATPQRQKSTLHLHLHTRLSLSVSTCRPVPVDIDLLLYACIKARTHDLC